MAHWWCPTCKQAILGCNVTYEEYHDSCGTSVEWVEGDNLTKCEQLEKDRDILEEKIITAEQERDELLGKTKHFESQLVHVYNSGYIAGHEDTVEGRYTDIVSADMDSYHADVVIELRAELLAEVQNDQRMPR